jgi:hypothetical protein
MLKRRNSIPGFQEGGMNVDPVSGNEVPVGSLPEEVRDDVDAKLSPGEFVIPADVVRFIGLERLMKMRDEAKKGIQRMSDIGQMGNADEVGEESNSTYEDDGFESEIDDILGEVENENGVNDQMKMAFGGYVKSGKDFSKAPDSSFDVRYYKGPNNQRMFITHINGKPMTPIPEGFKEMTPEEAMKIGSAEEEEKKVGTTSTGSATDTGGDAAMLDPTVAKWLDEEDRLQKIAEAEGRKGPRDLRMEKVGGILEKITGNLPFVGAAKKGASLLSKYLPTPTPEGFGAARLTATADVSMAQAAANDARQRALDSDFSSDAASRAAASAAEAVSRGVDPAVAVQAAIEAEQDVIDRESVSITGPGPSTGATASPVTSTGSTIESRDISAELNVGGGNESSVGTPETGSYSYSAPGGSFTSDSLTPYAKGGLVAKRQYPTKKKKGKGIAASK